VVKRAHRLPNKQKNLSLGEFAFQSQMFSSQNVMEVSRPQATICNSLSSWSRVSLAPRDLDFTDGISSPLRLHSATLSSLIEIAPGICARISQRNGDTILSTWPTTSLPSSVPNKTRSIAASTTKSERAATVTAARGSM